MLLGQNVVSNAQLQDPLLLTGVGKIRKTDSEGSNSSTNFEKITHEPDAFNESVVWHDGDGVGVLGLRKAISFHIAARRWRSPSTILECEDQHSLNYPVCTRLLCIELWYRLFSGVTSFSTCLIFYGRVGPGIPAGSWISRRCL